MSNETNDVHLIYQERQMTIKRGMTRQKTIKAQLSDIIAKIRQYAAVSDKHKHLLGDTNVNASDPAQLRKNHEQARQAVESLYQQFHDLVDEYMKITLAIKKANVENYITVAGKHMTLAEALIYKEQNSDRNGKPSISGYINALVNGYAESINHATNIARQYNQQFANVPEDTRRSLLADVLLLVDKERVAQLAEIQHKFLIEVDDELDAAIATTPITIVD